MTTEHDPRAWRVATALAHETGLDWARWASGRMRSSPGRAADTAIPPAPWDTEAYLADCRRRGVEPGPLPSLEYGNLADDDDIAWCVSVETVIRVGRRAALFVQPNGCVYGGAVRDCSIDDLVRAINLARVAAEAMR